MLREEITNEIKNGSQKNRNKRNTGKRHRGDGGVNYHTIDKNLTSNATGTDDCEL